MSHGSRRPFAQQQALSVYLDPYLAGRLMIRTEELEIAIVFVGDESDCQSVAIHAELVDKRVHSA